MRSRSKGRYHSEKTPLHDSRSLRTVSMWWSGIAFTYSKTRERVHKMQPLAIHWSPMSNGSIPEPRWSYGSMDPTMCYSRRTLALVLCAQKYRKLKACLRAKEACITEMFQAKLTCAWYRGNRAMLWVSACSVICELASMPCTEHKILGNQGRCLAALHHSFTITNRTYLFNFLLLFYLNVKR